MFEIFYLKELIGITLLISLMLLITWVMKEKFLNRLLWIIVVFIWTVTLYSQYKSYNENIEAFHNNQSLTCYGSEKYVVSKKAGWGVIHGSFKREDGLMLKVCRCDL